MKEDSLPTGRDGRDETGELIISYVDPVVRRIIRQKLSLYLNSSWSFNSRFESEDLYQTIIMKLINFLGAREAHSLSWKVDEIQKYVTAIAYNVCSDFIRAKYPERHRLKDKLRDLLKRHPSFSSWRIDDRWMCGFNRWTGKAESGKVATLLCYFDETGVVSDLKGLDIRDLSMSRTSKMIAELFCWLDGPIEIDHLVYVVARLKGIKDYPIASIDDQDFPTEWITDQTAWYHEQIEVQELLHQLWESICELPHNQRKTFFITSFDHAGESLLHRMLQEQIVTISQIYRALAMTREELILIWDRLPMDTSTAAIELGTTNRMIAKWRHRALKKLTIQCGAGKQSH